MVRGRVAELLAVSALAAIVTAAIAAPVPIAPSERVFGIGNGDRRPLSFAIGAWTWVVGGEQP